MHRFVQKVGFLPEMFKSLVESTSPKVVDKSQIEFQTKLINSQAKDVCDLQSVIQNLRNTKISQATVISTQKLKIKDLKKEVEKKSKQLEEQSRELKKLRKLQLKESKNRQTAKDKSLKISKQKSKITTLTSRNNNLNLHMKNKLSKFRKLTKRIATQSIQIDQLNKEVQEKFRYMQDKFIKEIKLFGSQCAERNKNLKLEVAKWDDQLRLHSEKTTSDDELSITISRLKNSIVGGGE